MDLTANALLAIGARPFMSAAKSEMQDIAHVADALLINIGTLDDNLIEAALLAGQTMRTLGKPIVLDPVGVQVSRYRFQTALRIIEACHPCVIKGNEEEMAALTPFIQPSSEQVLVTTGMMDRITDGHNEQSISGGSALMTQVTAMGCTAGAIIAAYLAKGHLPFTASVLAMQCMKKAGQEAQTEQGLGSYRQRFIDCLSRYA